MTQTNQMRRGFTMIELIFVIVIIGILAAVAIPKLAQNRDDATASVCASEVGNIVSSITNKYGQMGYTDFTTKLKVSDIFNGNVAVSGSQSGVKQGADNLVKEGVTYYCEGGQAVNVTFARNGQKYDMNLDTTVDPDKEPPAAVKAAQVIEKAMKIPTDGDDAHKKTIEL